VPKQTFNTEHSMFSANRHDRLSQQTPPAELNKHSIRTLVAGADRSRCAA